MAVPSYAQAAPATEGREDNKTGLIIGGVIGTLALLGAGAGVSCWAMQHGMILNPAPQFIPCHPPAPAPAPAPAPQPAPAPTPAPAPAPAAKAYRNCTAVWNDLGRPIRRGEAGYGSHLDRDGDGVGCEKRPR